MYYIIVLIYNFRKSKVISDNKVNQCLLDWAVAGVGEQVEGTQETFGADGCVHFLDYGDDP